MLKRLIFEDEHDWFRESVQTFIKRELEPQAEEIRENRMIPAEAWTKAGEAASSGLASLKSSAATDCATTASTRSQPKSFQSSVRLTDLASASTPTSARRT